MSDLKPCPFCGGKAITNTFLDCEDIENLPTNVIDDYEPEVTCENERCIYGWWLSPKDWNTRPIEDALHARIAELEAEIDEFLFASSNVLNPYDGISVPYEALKKLVKRIRKERER